MADDYFEFTVRLNQEQMLQLLGSGRASVAGTRTPRDIAIEEAAQYVLAAWDRWRPAAGDVYGMDKLRAALARKEKGE